MRTQAERSHYLLVFQFTPVFSITQLEKELREQTKQRELAESRVQDLLLMVGNDEDSTEWVSNFCRVDNTFLMIF